ncbi:MAG: SDR family oxidoreductase [Alphaproteobacteria bacterium]|nr:SDR family oxidoreductase [Alphaproteobacteria bacterium]
MNPSFAKAVLLTGAAGGLGAAMAEALAGDGHRLALVDRDEKRLQALTDRLWQQYGEGVLLPLALDLTDEEACAEAVGRAAERFGRLDMLVNNAGIGMSTLRPDYHLRPLAAFSEVSVEDWQRFVAVHATAPFVFMRTAAPFMQERGWGRIVNVTTSLSTMLRPQFFPYGASKAALEAMSSQFAGELQGSGITVNVLTPGGPTDTPMVTEESAPDRSALLSPAVMASPIRFLASEVSDGFTGRRIIAALWDKRLAPVDSAMNAGGPIGWPGTGPPAIWPEDMPGADRA